MASEKPTRILLSKSKSELSIEEISDLSDREAWRLIYSLPNKEPKITDSRLKICFTGFSHSRKQELVDLARDNRFKVSMSVTKKLDLLCGGDNAGPKKIEQAKEQGAQYLTENQFLSLVKDGEIPSL